jgi:hypothetical protein
MSINVEVQGPYHANGTGNFALGRGPVASDRPYCIDYGGSECIWQAGLYFSIELNDDLRKEMSGRQLYLRQRIYSTNIYLSDDEFCYAMQDKALDVWPLSEENLSAEDFPSTGGPRNFDCEGRFGCIVISYVGGLLDLIIDDASDSGDEEVRAGGQTIGATIYDGTNPEGRAVINATDMAYMPTFDEVEDATNPLIAKSGGGAAGYYFGAMVIHRDRDESVVVVGVPPRIPAYSPGVEIPHAPGPLPPPGSLFRHPGLIGPGGRLIPVKVPGEPHEISSNVAFVGAAADSALAMMRQVNGGGVSQSDLRELWRRASPPLVTRSPGSVLDRLRAAGHSPRGAPPVDAPLVPKIDQPFMSQPRPETALFDRWMKALGAET